MRPEPTPFRARAEPLSALTSRTGALQIQASLVIHLRPEEHPELFTELTLFSPIERQIKHLLVPLKATELINPCTRDGGL